MSVSTITGIFVIGLAAYRVTRLLVLDSLLDEPRMWLLRRLAPRPRGAIPGSRLRRTRIKVAEGIQCSYCVGVWVTIALAGLWHLGGGWRIPIVIAAAVAVQAFLASWEGG